MRQVTIGGGQGFWGDSNDAAIDMVRNEDLDYLACDYLAELTLSIMQRQRMRNPAAGYARDFITLMEAIAAPAFAKGTTVVTDAGGMNIKGCVDAVAAVATERDLRGYRIGYVEGDDLLDRVDELRAAGVAFDNIDETGDFDAIRPNVVNANVYFGHEPIVECLEQGADTVITGRATDSALFLAPLKHSLGWADDDWDRLARGIMAGHLLECGGQGAGGNFDYDWRAVPDMDRLGFPIAEVTDSSLVITKARDTGGLISEQSVKEQLLYEVHDPASYLTPDVTVDLSRASVRQIGDNRVAVHGIAGKPRPEQLKLSMGYRNGYRAVVFLSFAWPDAYEKAASAAEILRRKLERKGVTDATVHTSFIGLNSLHLDVANMDPEQVSNVNEVVLRMAVHTATKEAAAALIPEVAPLQLNGPPGASFFGGRARVQEVISLWPTLIPRDLVSLTPHILEVN